MNKNLSEKRSKIDRDHRPLVIVVELDDRLIVCAERNIITRWKARQPDSNDGKTS